MFSGRVHSILIKDIADVTVSSNPLYATLQISGGDYKGMPTSDKLITKGPLAMRFLNKKEVAKARRVIFGLKKMHDRKVDTSKMPVEEVVSRAEELGRARKDGRKEDEGEGGSAAKS